MVNDNANSDKHIYTTFIGIGVDFYTSMIEKISYVRGSNYFSVNSREEFEQLMINQFDYMVSPLLFDLKFFINVPKYWQVDGIYGSNAPHTLNKYDSSFNGKSRIELVSISTLFPTITRVFQNDEKRKIKQAKGGITLIKLTKRDHKSTMLPNMSDFECGTKQIDVTVAYTDRFNQIHTHSEIIEFDTAIGREHDTYFGNNGIRKAVLLSQYVRIVHEWIDANHTLSRLQLKSKPQWHAKFVRKLETFEDHFEQEMNDINDTSLMKEKDVIKWLSKLMYV